MTNKFIYKIFTLNPDEDLIKVARQSKWRLVFGLIPPAILIVTPFFFLFPLFYWGTKGIIIFFASLILGIFLLIRNTTLWYFKVFIITSQRIIDVDQKKIFNRIVSDIPLNKVQDVFYQINGLLQTMARVGDIQVIISDNKTRIEVKNIFQPHKIQQLILQLRLDSLEERLKNAQLSAQELVNLVKKIKTGLGEDDFQKIINEKKEK